MSGQTITHQKSHNNEIPSEDAADNPLVLMSGVQYRLPLYIHMYIHIYIYIYTHTLPRCIPETTRVS